jgi:predicted transcriptional regulator
LSRRSRLDIYFVVLEAIGNGIDVPTRITYETNLPWEVGCDVFDDLVRSGFIREEKEKNSVRFDLTKKGRNVLSYYLKALEERARLIQSDEIF